MEGHRYGFCVKMEWVILLGGCECFLENMFCFWGHRNCCTNAETIFCQHLS